MDNEEELQHASRRETGRRQSLRGGSAESALTTVAAGRSLVGEGLRAAGLNRRSRDTGDLDVGGVRPERSTDGFNDQRSRSRLGGADLSDSRTRAGTITAPRAATSMAEYRNMEGDPKEDEPRTAPPGLRTYKSAYHLPQRGDSREPADRAGSSLSRYNSPAHLPSAPQDRHSSPFSTRRFDPVAHSTSANGGAQQQQQQQQSEHTRLMVESLNMFESHLSRTPFINSLNGGDDLMRNAQAMVQSAEKLNAMLKLGTNRALEEQIDAEVGDSNTNVDLSEIWRRVGGDYREGLRASDDLVRSITGFMLGVGKALRDIGGSEDHRRTVSLDDEGLGRASRMSPDVTGASGRRSADSRRSWEPPRERDDLSKRPSGRPESVLAQRPSSSMNMLKDSNNSPAPSKNVGRNGTPNGINSSSMRRLYIPREQRELQQLQQDSSPRGVVAADSQETLHAYEPSPTPAPRKPRVQETPDRSRTLPPISIPKPLPTLPSETNRQPPTADDKSSFRQTARRRASLSRGPLFPSITTPNATTAITPHTVSNSPERMAFPVMRSDSAKSRSTVTFSRASTVSALSGLQQQHLADQRKRTTSTGSNLEPEPTSATTPVTRAASGSETERDSRQRTIDRAPRISLDGARDRDTIHAADRSAAAILQVNGSGSRTRRKTVMEMFPASGR